MNRLPLPLIAAIREPKALRTISEKAFQEAVIEYAKSQNWIVWFTWRSVHSPFGEPDLRMVNAQQRRIVFAELKSETGRLTFEQKMALEAVKESGHEGALWRPSDAAQVMNVLDGEERLI